MAETFKKLAQGQLPSTVGVLYTVPSATSTIVKTIKLVNNTGATKTAKLFHDGSSDAEAILPTSTIQAGGWAEFEGTMTMEAADTLQGVADVATSVTYTVYGLEIT